MQCTKTCDKNILINTYVQNIHKWTYIYVRVYMSIYRPEGDKKCKDEDGTYSLSKFG